MANEAPIYDVAWSVSMQDECGRMSLQKWVRRSAPVASASRFRHVLAVHTNPIETRVLGVAPVAVDADFDHRKWRQVLCLKTTHRTRSGCQHKPRMKRYLKTLKVVTVWPIGKYWRGAAFWTKVNLPKSRPGLSSTSFNPYKTDNIRMYCLKTFGRMPTFNLSYPPKQRTLLVRWIWCRPEKSHEVCARMIFQ